MRDVRHEADDVPPVRALDEGLEVQRLVHHAPHLVVDAQAALLHDDAALLLEVLLGDGEVRHPVALEVEHDGQRLAREVVQVRGVVARRVAVGGAAVPFDQVVEHPGPELLATVEHHVLEEMRDAGGAAHLVARADVVEDVGRDDGRGVILVHDDAEPVRERARHHRQLEGEREPGHRRQRGEQDREAAPHGPCS